MLLEHRLACFRSRLPPNFATAPNLRGVKRNGLMIRKELVLNCFYGLDEEERLAFEEGQPSENEESIGRVVLVARFIKIEKIHSGVLRRGTKHIGPRMAGREEGNWRSRVARATQPVAL